MRATTMIGGRLLGLALLLALPAGLPGQAKDGKHHDTVTIDVPPSYGPGEGDVPDLAAAVKQIVDRTNAFRKAEGHPAVRPNTELTAAAAYFAGYMAEHDKYGHQADEKTPADRAKKAGYEYCLVLENIAYQYSSAGFVTAALAGGFFEGWKKSPGHRKNMLDPDVSETAVAIALSKKTGHYYAVQLFGRPKADHIEFHLANTADAAVRYTLDARPFELPPGTIRTHEECRPPVVTFAWPAADGKTAEGPTIRPKAGEQYRVRKTADGFNVKRQPAE